MKKLTVLLILFSIWVIPSYAQISFDTLSVRQINPGVKHIQVRAPSIPWVLDIVEIEIQNSDLFVETVKGEDRLAGYERPSSMAARKSAPGRQVIATINGDFYGGGIPVNTQVINGEILKKPFPRDVFGINDVKEMFIEVPVYGGMVIKGSDTLGIGNINGPRNENQIAFYNHYFGNSSNTNAFGTELLLRPVDPWVVNGNVRAVIEQKYVNQGSSTLTDSTFILSGHGTMSAALQNYSVGDTLTVSHNLNPGVENLTQVIGGSEKILKDGENAGNWEERHPRTAIGYNADQTKLYFITVDGRQSSSAGMTLNEMGDFFKTFGIDRAINLDGGGSTVMVVHDEVVSSPSDGSGERAVANAIMLVSKAPKVGALQNLNLSPGFNKVFRTQSFKFDYYGSDENFYPLTLNPSNVSFSLSEGLDASISNDGLFTAGTSADTGFVYIEYEGIRDSSEVIIKGITDFNLYPKFAVTDTSDTILFFNQSFDFDGQKQNVANNQVTWVVENPEIGNIGLDGHFKGLTSGTTNVIGMHDGVSDTVEVDVRIAEGYQLIDSFSDLNNWTLEGENIDLENSTISISEDFASEGNSSLKIDYSFTYNNSPNVWIYLKSNIPVYSIPDTILVDAKSNGLKHLVEFDLSDNNDELFYIRVKKWLENTSFDRFPALPADRLTRDSFNTFFYPVTIKAINIRLASAQQNGQTYSGSIYLDNLRIAYPGATLVSNENEFENKPNQISLSQNYPNPFNPTTNIQFELDQASNVTLKVFDLLGRELETLVNERMSAGTHVATFNAENYSSGMYFYQLKATDVVATRRMLLIK